MTEKLYQARLRARARVWAQELGEDPGQVGKSIPVEVGLNMRWDELPRSIQDEQLAEFRKLYRRRDTRTQGERPERRSP